MIIGTAIMTRISSSDIPIPIFMNTSPTPAISMLTISVGKKTASKNANPNPVSRPLERRMSLIAPTPRNVVTMELTIAGNPNKIATNTGNWGLQIANRTGTRPKFHAGIRSIPTIALREKPVRSERGSRGRSDSRKKASLISFRSNTLKAPIPMGMPINAASDHGMMARIRKRPTNC
jgi:hypothetical protein